MGIIREGSWNIFSPLERTANGCWGVVRGVVFQWHSVAGGPAGTFDSGKSGGQIRKRDANLRLPGHFGACRLPRHKFGGHAEQKEVSASLEDAVEEVKDLKTERLDKWGKSLPHWGLSLLPLCWDFTIRRCCCHSRRPHQPDVLLGTALACTKGCDLNMHRGHVGADMEGAVSPPGRRPRVVVWSCRRAVTAAESFSTL